MQRCNEGRERKSDHQYISPRIFMRYMVGPAIARFPFYAASKHPKEQPDNAVMHIAWYATNT